MSKYNPHKIEQKWQAIWEDTNAFALQCDPSLPKAYVLEMLPYPSGRLHMGHVRVYTLGDAVARFKKALGYNVLHPIGWDSFGLPAENAAIESNVSPKKWTASKIKSMKEAFKKLGISYDWNREIATSDPSYYMQQQKIFLDFYHNGLAYRKKSLVNWDPVEKTVLANEQVIDGKGWRSGATITKKSLNQWFIKITAYADQLLADLDTLKGWPEKVKIMQQRWIGRSEGMHIAFSISTTSSSLSENSIDVYTTKPETLFGASFLALSPDHPLLERMPKSEEMEIFIKKCQSVGTSEKNIEKSEKLGYKIPLYVTHPFTKKKIPVYIANYVLIDYGTGAIFGCPGHDERDHEFAQKYSLPICPVLEDPESASLPGAYPTGENTILINSEFLNGLSPQQAREQAMQRLEALHVGERCVNYRLKDWGVSRQRYWGCPIPIVHCPECGIVPLEVKDLPVLLPEEITFTGKGNPLEESDWRHTACPKCGSAALRETDTLDTFFDSSWYFLRYCSPHAQVPIDKKDQEYWMAVDQYMGGVEHAVMHLLYARFFTKVLYDMGYVSYKEPFLNLLTQGMVCHKTYKNQKGKWIYPEEVFEKNGQLVTHSGEPITAGPSEKMSKSKCNVIEPSTIIEAYGADTARLFILSDTPPEKDFEWSDSGIQGCWRFLNKIWDLAIKTSPFYESPFQFNKLSDSDHTFMQTIQKTLYAVSEDYQKLHFNKAIARIREFTNSYTDYIHTDNFSPALGSYGFRILMHLLSPITPHITEEIWGHIGETGTLYTTPWPSIKHEYLTQNIVTYALQVNGKLRASMDVEKDLSKEDLITAAKKIGNLAKHIEKSPPKKIIVVPNKVINFVV